MLNEPPEPLQSFAPLSENDPASLARVDELISRYREFSEAGSILPNTVEAMRVELTYHSNAIEGSTLTLRDTQLVVEGREPNTGKSLREIYEARNHDRALREIESWVNRQRGELCEDDLLATHAAVMADIAQQGAIWRFRVDGVLISSTKCVTLGNQKLQILIPKLIELANRPSIHPILQAAELHYNFVAIHPFAASNGRTARLLMNYQLLRAGYPLTVIPVERRPEDLASLASANEGQLEPFASFVTSCTEHSILRILGEEPG